MISLFWFLSVVLSFAVGVLFHHLATRPIIGLYWRGDGATYMTGYEGSRMLAQVAKSKVGGWHACLVVDVEDKESVDGMLELGFRSTREEAQRLCLKALKGRREKSAA